MATARFGLSLTALESLLSTLLAPSGRLEQPTWRDDVARLACALLGTERAVLVLESPVETVGHGTGIAADTVHQYLESYHALDFGMLRQRRLGLEVWSRRALWKPHELRRSEYYHEFALPNRIVDAAGLTVVDPKLQLRARLSLLFDRRLTPQHLAQCYAALRTIVPAFKSAMYAHCRFREWSRELTGLLDSAAGSLLVFDIEGRQVHRSEPMETLLAAEPDREQLAVAVGAMADSMARALRDHDAPLTPERLAPMRSELQTAHARYTLHGVVLGTLEPECDRRIVVIVRRDAGTLPSSASLRVRFGLTERQSAVAHLLAMGQSNAEIAHQLSISPHTAERHTEQVLLKLGARSRAQVGALLTASRAEHGLLLDGPVVRPAATRIDDRRFVAP